MKAADSQPVNADTDEPGRYPGRAVRGAEASATICLRPKAESSGLMEAVCERGNLWLAYERVIKNKGAAGVDGIGVAEFKDQLKRY